MVTSPKANGVTAFISYSHDSKEHENRVRELVDRLCIEGIDCIFDQYVQSPNEGWPKWMIHHSENSDFILIICTEIYEQRSKSASNSVSGKGVKFESLLTYQDLLDAGSISARLIPIVFNSSSIDFIPRPLKSFQHYILDTDEGYELLYRRLTGQPRIVKPTSRGIREFVVGENLNNLGSHDHEGKFAPTEGRSSQAQVAGENSERIATIELHIAKPFKEFTSADQEALLRAIRELLIIKGDLLVRDLREGSVIISIDMPYSNAFDLMTAVAAGKLSELNVISSRISDADASDLLRLSTKNECMGDDRRKSESVIENKRDISSVSIAYLDDVVIICPIGYFNALIGDMVDKICIELMQEGRLDIVIDFSGVELINTIGVSILSGVLHSVLEKSGSIYFTNLNGVNREILDVLGFTNMAMIYITNMDACEHIKATRAARNTSIMPWQ